MDKINVTEAMIQAASAECSAPTHETVRRILEAGLPCGAATANVEAAAQVVPFLTKNTVARMLNAAIAAIK